MSTVKGIKDNKCLSEIDFTELKDSIKREVLELSFPIGSPYITQEDTNPATILGFGTWERVKGKVLVGLNEDDEYFNEIGKEGGETTHKLTISELPKHRFSYTRYDWYNAVIDPTAGGHGREPLANPTTVYTNYVGEDKAHNNVQPYKVVGYMWERTA